MIPFTLASCRTKACMQRMTDGSSSLHLEVIGEIEGPTPHSIEATDVLFENCKRSVVLQCIPQDCCLKLIKDPAIFDVEYKAYQKLKETPDAKRLFLPIYFFCQLRGAVGGAWKGYFMKQGLYSLRELIYKHSEADVQYQNAIQILVKQRNKCLQKGHDVPPLHQQEGIPVHFKHNQSIKLSLSVAALQLLRRLHSHGWVHGDSHLGNFVYCCDGNVYAIDFERSFRSTDVVQHLMDIQEAFGHLSGIMIHVHNHHEWDMRDLPGIHFHRHPLLGPLPDRIHNKRYSIPSPIQRRIGFLPRRKALYMLPVCKCFTAPTELLRTNGCSMCCSQLNRRAAQHFAECGDELIQVCCIAFLASDSASDGERQDLENWGLTKLRASLLQTRHDCLHKCAYIASIIHPCMKDIRVGDDDYENDAIKELTQNRTTCCTALKRLLYTPSLSPRALDLARRLSVKLQQAGHTEAARVFWLYVAPPYPCS